jgi:nicotinate-nucleotide pyrophosphorylase
MGRMWTGDALAEERIREFLLEDLGYGDITSDALIPPYQRAKARL